MFAGWKFWQAHRCSPTICGLLNSGTQTNLPPSFFRPQNVPVTGPQKAHPIGFIARQLIFCQSIEELQTRSTFCHYSCSRLQLGIYIASQSGDFTNFFAIVLALFKTLACLLLKLTAFTVHFKLHLNVLHETPTADVKGPSSITHECRSMKQSLLER